jgi:hypothetical protein
MKIENQESFVEIEADEFFDLQGRYDLRCHVKVLCDGFSGEINSVWISDEDIKSFIKELENLDKTRKGTAELLNMSSGSDVSPIEFKIFATDSLGHLAVRAQLRKLVFFKDSYEISTISTVFEIDGGSLLPLINEFKKLLKFKPLE